MVGKTGFDAVAGIVGQRQRDSPGRCNRTVVREAAAILFQVAYQLRILPPYLLHVTAVAGVQHLAFDSVAGLPVIHRHLGTLCKHFGGDGELLFHDRRRPFLFSQLQTGLPAHHGQFPGNPLGELERARISILHLQHGDTRPQAEISHAVAAFAHNFIALLFQRQSVDLHHVVQHAGEYRHHLAELFPIEIGVVGERVAHEFGQIDRTQQAGAVRRQWLFAAGIGGADTFAEPVIVHLVDLVDENKTRFGEIVS